MTVKKDKQVFDYKEPFQAPYMVREITKKIRLKNAISGQSIFVFGFTSLFCLLILYPMIGFTQFLIVACLVIPYGMVELFNRVEPDGKKVHAFLIDYFRFVFIYQIGKKVLQQAELIKIRNSKMIYKKEKISDLKINKVDRKENGYGVKYSSRKSV